MADYSKGKIYKICAPGCDNVYIGSTICDLNLRMALHKSDYKNGFNNSSKHIIQKEGAFIELIEEFPCKCRRDLEMREKEILTLYHNAVNTRNPYRTNDEKKEYSRKYYAQYHTQKRIERAAKKENNLTLPVE